MTNREVAHAFVSGNRAQVAHLTATGIWLTSYTTEVAHRNPDGSIGVNPVKYSPTTSRHLSELRSALRTAGYQETEKTEDIGVWYWHQKSVVPFVIWERI